MTHSQSITIPRGRKLSEMEHLWRWALGVAVLAVIVVGVVVATVLVLVWTSPPASAPPAEGGGDRPPVAAETSNATAATSEEPVLTFRPPPSSPPPTPAVATKAPPTGESGGADGGATPTKSAPIDGGGAKAAEVASTDAGPTGDRSEAGTAEAPLEGDGSPVAQKASPRDGEEREGVPVTLASSPSGLTVFVGSRRIGTTPTKTTLRPGSHKVRVLSRSAGIDYRTKMIVPAGGSHRETISVSKGSLAFRVRPYALVFVDGKRIGLTPMPPVALYAGRHSVRLLNDTLGKTVSKSVTVRSGRRSTVDVDMTKVD